MRLAFAVFAVAVAATPVLFLRNVTPAALASRKGARADALGEGAGADPPAGAHAQPMGSGSGTTR